MGVLMRAKPSAGCCLTSAPRSSQGYCYPNFTHEKQTQVDQSHLSNAMGR